MQNNQSSRGYFVKLFSNMVFKTFNLNQAIITAMKYYNISNTKTREDFPDINIERGQFVGHGLCALAEHAHTTYLRFTLFIASASLTKVYIEK